MTEIELKRMYAAYKAKQVKAERKAAFETAFNEPTENAEHYTDEHLEAIQALNDFENPADFLRVAVRS